jgi:hypothetical protein
MNENFQKAEKIVKEVIEELKRLLPRDGEDISFYNHCVLDESISDLIEAKAEMAIGRQIDG